MNQDARLHSFSRVVSFILGWTSFLLWSISFYPQAVLNWRRKSTQGVSIDFPAANVLGFSAYTIYTGLLSFSPVIRSEYKLRHPKTPEPSVRVNDFFYALHGATLCIVTYSMFYPRLWRFKVGPMQRVSKIMSLLLIGGLCYVFAVTCLVAVHRSPGKHILEGWAWIDIAYALSNFKLFTTVIKYCPQAYLNYKRKATKGWSITAILLDLTGGIASLLQLLVDGAFDADWGSVTGNPAKFFLGNITMFFDIIFMLQHYVLYKDPGKGGEVVAEEDTGEEERLLNSPNHDV